MPSPSRPVIEAFFDRKTNTVSYLVWDRATGEGAVIDPVLDFDETSGDAARTSVDLILSAAEAAGVSIAWVLETHVHADHLSGAPYIKLKTGAQVAIGEQIRDIQRIFRPIFNANDVSGDGAEFDRLFKDNDRFMIGAIPCEVMHTPGHTPACVSYLIGDDVVFVGDTLFMPDAGTARADFPGGDARALFRSIRRLLALPSQTRLFMCHDYKSPTRDSFAWETTVADERERNIHIHDGVDEDAFVAMRTARDRTLSSPKLLLPSIQVNIRAGQMPPADANGIHYLKLPVRLAS